MSVKLLHEFTGQIKLFYKIMENTFNKNFLNFIEGKPLLSGLSVANYSVGTWFKPLSSARRLLDNWWRIPASKNTLKSLF